MTKTLVSDAYKLNMLLEKNMGEGYTQINC